MTLKDVLSENPGMSVQDALQRMHAINTAVATGAEVPPLSVSQTGLSSIQFNAQAQLAATKTQREIYVGNIPPGITIPQLTEFINEAMKQLGLAQQSPFGGPVVTCWISTDSHYAFVEFRTVEEATSALTGLSGISCGGYQLRVGRPKTNQPQVNPLGQALGVGQVMPPIGGYGIGSVATMPAINIATAKEAVNVLMVANLPDTIGEAQVRELLEPFGTIKLFNFIKVPLAGGSGGAAVLEYEDKSVADSAIKGLNGLAVGGKQLSVQRVPPNMTALLLKPSSQAAAPSAQSSSTAPVENKSSPATETTETASDLLLSLGPTAVLRMSNMTNREELQDDEVYEELQEDIADECNNHGTVRSIVIPRPNPGGDESGVGEVFVCFTHAEAAERTRKAVNGRTFGGSKVKAVFYPEDLFHSKVYTLPEGYKPNTDDNEQMD